MDSESIKKKENRFTKNRQKKRQLFQPLDHGQINTNNQLRLEDDSQLFVPIANTQPMFSSEKTIEQNNRLFKLKAKDASSKFIRNQMYFGEILSNQAYTYDHEQIRPQSQDPQFEEAANQQKKIRKTLKRKKKQDVAISFQQIKIVQQVNQKNKAPMQIINFQQLQPNEQQVIFQNGLRNSSDINSNITQIQSINSTGHIVLRLDSNTNVTENDEQVLSIQSSCNKLIISSLTNLLGSNDINKLKPMMYSSIPKNTTMRCYLKRLTSFKLSFELYLDDNSFLMKAQQQSGSIGSNYYISLSSQINKNNETYLGKLRGQFSGRMYSIYDSGASQKQMKSSTAQKRMCLGNIQYESNILGIKGPRKLKVAIPHPSIVDKSIFQIKEKQTLFTSFKQQDTQKLMILNNKKPVWSQRLKTFALNFGGRVKVPSIKNFILQNNEGEQILIFGKTESNTFNIEFRYPLSPFQAFLIVITSFDSKVSCQ